MNSHYSASSGGTCILLRHAETCRVSCSENREIVSPCMLITPNAFDLGAACRLNVTVSRALCSSRQAGPSCLGDGLVSLSAAVAREAVIPARLAEVCVTPRALPGDPAGARCPTPSPERPSHPSPPRDCPGTPGTSFLTEACLSLAPVNQVVFANSA